MSIQGYLGRKARKGLYILEGGEGEREGVGVGWDERYVSRPGLVELAVEERGYLGTGT